MPAREHLCKAAVAHVSGVQGRCGDMNNKERLFGTALEFRTLLGHSCKVSEVELSKSCSAVMDVFLRCFFLGFTYYGVIWSRAQA